MKNLHLSSLAIVCTLGALASGCDKKLEPKYRDRLDERVEKFRKETPTDCTLAADIYRDMEHYSDGAYGWSKEDNEIMISWKREKEEICEAANGGSPSSP